MNLWILKPGHKVRMRNGAVARVKAETEDGTSIRVEYLESEGAPSPVGVEDVVNEREVEVLLGFTHPRAWEEEVTVVIHQIPESEDSEVGFEAVTVKGVPYGVSVTGYSSDSAQGALGHLLNGLRAFGFNGRVAVEDATKLGRPERYEIST